MIILPRNINNVTVKKQGTVLPFLPIKRGGEAGPSLCSV